MELIKQSLKVLGSRSLQKILISARERLAQDLADLSLGDTQAAGNKCLIKVLEGIFHRPHPGPLQHRKRRNPDNLS